MGVGDLDWVRSFGSQNKQALYTCDLGESVGTCDGMEVWRGLAARLPRISDARLLQYLDLKTWLADDILTKLDKMSMASSVEARAPYLDYHLVEWTLGLPEEYLLKGVTGKRLLRSVGRDYPTSGGGVPEVLGPDGATGVIIPPSDAQAMEAAILALIGDPARRVRMGCAGRQRAEALFAVEDHARAVEAVYAEVMRGG